MTFDANETSLAHKFMAEVRHTVPKSRNDELALMQTSDFMAIPVEKRDLAWIAHCIKRCRGYKLDNKVLDAIGKQWEGTNISIEKRKKFNQILEENPKLYTVPFPVMWLEWSATNQKGDFIRNVYC